ncbi:TIGR03086 family protein [Nakamurella flavida]|uniref:TIGR03086 family protein n=1 Tax=Nakamurella flavida TaxID=363630 RepID=A0A938YLR9_9ACTN|nr:TIGR03086 family metal-binding protein [Nakamurella flavida]MBM9477033.1 TIGR03086 family protein [Nakamurella flavida]MDP9779979.1 uncharacterized protein (TIGR03086 family) [Nakamurella flavida]
MTRPDTTTATAPQADELDPRPLYRAGLTWAHGLIAAVRPEQLGDPTPCVEFDVRTLVGHLVATVDRARVIGSGGDPGTVEVVVTGVPDDGWADAYAAAVRVMWPVWEGDDSLDAMVTAPWGRVPGRNAVWGYLRETVVHGWDLAVATGQDPEVDPAVVGPLLQRAPLLLPAEPRGGFIPFAPVVIPRPGAGQTEQLANWAGRPGPS